MTEHATQYRRMQDEREYPLLRFRESVRAILAGMARDTRPLIRAYEQMARDLAKHAPRLTASDAVERMKLHG